MPTQLGFDFGNGPLDKKVYWNPFSSQAQLLIIANDLYLSENEAKKIELDIDKSRKLILPVHKRNDLFFAATSYEVYDTKIPRNSALSLLVNGIRVKSDCFDYESVTKMGENLKLMLGTEEKVRVNVTTRYGIDEDSYQAIIKRALNADELTKLEKILTSET